MKLTLSSVTVRVATKVIYQEGPYSVERFGESNDESVARIREYLKLWGWNVEEKTSMGNAEFLKEALQRKNYWFLSKDDFPVAFVTRGKGESIPIPRPFVHFNVGEGMQPYKENPRSIYHRYLQILKRAGLVQ